MYLYLGVLAVVLALGGSSVEAHNLTENEVLAWESPPQVRKDFPFYLSGYDEEGIPIFVWEFGHWDVRKYVEKGGQDLRNIDIHIDYMFLTFREFGRTLPGKQFIPLMDMADYPIAQATHFQTTQLILTKFISFEQIARNGDMKIGFVINANYLWEQLWKLGSPLLGALNSKIEFYGTNAEKWKPKLLQHLPKDQIAPWYGGSKDHKAVKVYR